MPGTDQARTLASEWWSGYQREAVSESGDPEAFIENIRELAERARPDAPAHQALALFLEQLRQADLDVEAPEDE